MSEPRFPQRQQKIDAPATTAKNERVPRYDSKKKVRPRDDDKKVDAPPGKRQQTNKRAPATIAKN